MSGHWPPLLEQHLNMIFQYISQEGIATRRDSTNQQHRLADYAFQTGHPLGLLIKSLVAPGSEALDCALKAEEMGCTHPSLNAIIAIQYSRGFGRGGGKSPVWDYATAILYHERCIRGTSILPWISIEET